MPETVLLVDDDPRVLTSLQRSLYKSHRVHLATDANEALATIRESRYAVIVSDLNMPGMNGIELLSRVKELSPETVRILLTGQADLEAAIDAVNEGSVFRFLRKPCPQELFVKTLDAGLAQYRLAIAERRVLQETLMGTMAVLIEILSTVEPVAFGRAVSIQGYVRKMALQLKVKDLWQFEAAAILSQIGCVSVAWDLLDKYLAGDEMSEQELAQVHAHAKTGADLLHRVPRLQTVAQIIGRQNDAYAEQTALSPEEQTVALGAQMLKVALDFDRLIRRKFPPEAALAEMQAKPAEYNPVVLSALKHVVVETAEGEPAHLARE